MRIDEYIKKNNAIIAMIKRLIAKIRRKDRMLKDLCNEWRIMWRLKKMDKT